MPILEERETMMQRTVEDLISILEKQIGNYRELKGLVLEERKAIVSNDLKDLSETTSQVGLLVASNNQLEMARVNLVKRLATILNLTESSPTLSHVARRLQGPLSEKLVELRRDMVSAIGEVQRQNRINAEMLKYCAGLIDSVLRNLVDPVSSKAIYGNMGQAKRRATLASLLDHHV
jgi:flagellar biosynthesis/type III secretory pathway chaperone